MLVGSLVHLGRLACGALSLGFHLSLLKGIGFRAAVVRVLRSLCQGGGVAVEVVVVCGSGGLASDRSGYRALCRSLVVLVVDVRKCVVSVVVVVSVVEDAGGSGSENSVRWG